MVINDLINQRINLLCNRKVTPNVLQVIYTNQQHCYCVY